MLHSLDLAPPKGTESCTWELNPGHFKSGVTQDPATCRQHAADKGFEYLGEGAKWSEAQETLKRACACGETQVRMFFDPARLTQPNPHPCLGTLHSCTKPGPRCRWEADEIVVDPEAHPAVECSSRARSCGDPYFGVNAREEALKAPEGSCVCGESTTRWYLDAREHACKGYRHRCLRPWAGQIRDWRPQPMPRP